MSRRSPRKNQRIKAPRCMCPDCVATRVPVVAVQPITKNDLPKGN